MSFIEISLGSSVSEPIILSAHTKVRQVMFATMAFVAFSPSVSWSQDLPISKTAECSEALDFTYKALGEDRKVHLCDAYQGKLVLVVNTASKCAFTPQYDGLEALYATYIEKGLVVLGFPSNDFAGQEPGTEQQIQNFCRLTYGVNFPMFEKVRVTQNEASPIYEWLAQKTGEYPGWNFHKYLISPSGEVIASFKSHIKPEDTRIVTLIEQHLPAQ